MANEGNEVIIAMTNVRHLFQFVDAREWRLIRSKGLFLRGCSGLGFRGGQAMAEILMFS